MTNQHAFTQRTELIVVLYEISLQIIPTLMIALFLNTRTSSTVAVHRQRRADVQKQTYVLLCVSAFAVSLSVVSGILDAGKITEALVIGALMGCTVLMATRAWRRSGSRSPALVGSEEAEDRW